MTADGAAGKLFIAASAESIERATVARVLREAGYAKAPICRAPTILLKFLALFDGEVSGMVPFIEKAAAFDNQASFDVVRWQPTPLETSFKEMAAAISQSAGSNIA
jgi:hypothetical protein